MTLGQPCVHQVMVYKDSTGFSNQIMRHNCRTPAFYCDTGYNVCLSTKALGLACGADQECHSVIEHFQPSFCSVLSHLD